MEEKIENQENRKKTASPKKKGRTITSTLVFLATVVIVGGVKIAEKVKNLKG